MWGYNISSTGARRKIIKIILAGDGAVGKTSIRHRYLGQGFKKSYMATIGADFAIKRIDKDGNKVAQIWDLAGQPRFSVVREGYYIGTKGAILVFDISRPQTYFNIPNWIREMMENIPGDDVLPMVFVGNKADLRGNKGEFIETNQAAEYAQQLSDWSELEVPYIESSAKTGLNVDFIFESLVKNIEIREGETFSNF